MSHDSMLYVIGTNTKWELRHSKHDAPTACWLLDRDFDHGWRALAATAQAHVKGERRQQPRLQHVPRVKEPSVQGVPSLHLKLREGGGSRGGLPGAGRGD